MTYVVCIPTYKRAKGCNDKTLATLHKHSIDPALIYVYVANQEEYAIYKEILSPVLYNSLIVGKEGLVPQRQFISEQWDHGKHIVFFDDDIESINISLSPRFKEHTLDSFITTAFDECENNHAYIWGVYPVWNPFFRSARQEISTNLSYIVGAMYAIINRPNLTAIQLKLTEKNGQKEDVERTLKYFINDSIVIRFNKIGIKTKYFGKEGGLGKFNDRIQPMKDACQLLEEKYGEYGYTKVRKNGMFEFVLKKSINNKQKPQKPNPAHL